MKIRKKILLYFSLIIPAIIGIAFIAIYILSAENREESFQMRQKDKIATTLEILSDIKETDEDIIEALDQISINELYNEKLLLFNQDKKLIYSNIVDIPVPVSKNILIQLNQKTKWIETKDGLYDVVGTYVERKGKIYYGISKAYDDFGYSKLRYLKYILFLIFIIITIIILLVSFYIARKITNPLEDITTKISGYNFTSTNLQPIAFKDTRDEIAVLATVFNELMNRMNDAFAFQKHAIHHISHELKTPIAILVSNFERLEKETNLEELKLLIQNQKEDTLSLSEIINSLLEISKIETSNQLLTEKFRIDELIFDVSDKLKNVYPDFVFSVDYEEPIHENHLEIVGNSRLIQAALSNLMENCIHYSSNRHASIRIQSDQQLTLIFENEGAIINKQEISYLFQHFFRGGNSKGKRGFGLGLVFVNKIIAIHGGTITYESFFKKTNRFKITLP
ncbi:HAMP domain-containing sensor histidine kinase [Fluviicola taffensis]|uniref:histidine kinase n=1 Tax=Fluviicola taffensis (strain DSM 16823 / NCIMB 13979 / RW262) TaxID=755732 RepID=F2IB26_FLUTR|nr:HAMP domain-containing sensor histidine kinase [Fluviicola taffensis]AEA42109.1 integral membrane sensor signal transduction histidine kinase [Fluviicola taffensis DSM 16823]